MRLLYLPMYSNKNLNGCSSYNTGKKFVASAVERGWFVHWVLPKTGGWKNFYYASEPDPIEFHPRVKVHRFEAHDCQHLQSGIVPVDFLYFNFSQHEGEYPIDAILTEKPASANFIKKVLQHPFVRKSKSLGRYAGKNPPLPVFIRDPFVKSESLHGVSNVEEIEQSTGYLLNNCIFMSPADLETAKKVMARYLNFGQIKQVIDNSIVIPSGTAVDELREIRENTPKRDKFTVLIAERLKTGDQAENLAAVDYMFKSGSDMHVVVSSQANFNPHTVGNYPTLFEHAELYSGNPRQKYLPIAASCHATITVPATHSYPQGLMEQLYLGLVAILPDYPWVDAILPNYPFKVRRSKMEEMVGMLEWVRDNYEEAKRMIAWVPDYIEEHYAAKVLLEKTLDFIEKRTFDEVDGIPPSSGILEIAASIPVDEITQDQLFDFMYRRARNRVDFRNTTKTAAFGNSKSMLFRIMRSLGWKDLCDSPYGHFVRGVKAEGKLGQEETNELYRQKRK